MDLTIIKWLLGFALFTQITQSCDTSFPNQSNNSLPPLDTIHPEIQFGFNAWNDLYEAQSISSQTGKPIFLMFSSFAEDSDPKSQWTILQEEPLQSMLNNDFVFTVLYTDDRQKITVLDSTFQREITLGQYNKIFKSVASKIIQCGFISFWIPT